MRRFQLTSKLESALFSCFTVVPFSFVRFCGPFVVLTTSSAVQKKLQLPTRPAEDVVRTMKCLQERTRLIEWDDHET